jgi:hypothetical protein
MNKMQQLTEILLRRKEIQKSYRQVFNTEDGKLVLSHLMKNGFITKTTFVAGDPHQTAMNEGSRRVVLSILAFMNRDEKEMQKQIEQELQNEI